MKKLMTFSDFRRMFDRTIPTLIRMQTMSTPDRYTQLTINSIRFNDTIPENVFSLQNLCKR